ncbi:unnamed protein product [Heligmosomoides polygyrus]|uniref:60S ribosomal protein L35 n=1 Tax=Heligmosomoides polygyrus TaxID=6339 RepID=A0A3P8BN28_HELPZ|nr:unnamed protein product [Heligmosomoides polygyrus]
MCAAVLAVSTFALEARNACETVGLQHLNAWRDDPEHSSRTVSLGARLAKTNSLGVCLALHSERASKGIKNFRCRVVRLIPQLREQLDEYLKTVPDFVKNDIEKSSRNLIFSMIGSWLLTGCWLSLAVSNDWVASPVVNMLTLSSALLYCAFDLLQFAVTTPLVYSKLVCLAIKWLPASLAPKQDPVTMMKRSEVIKRFQGYVPRVVRSEMKKRWSRGYKRLREIHDRKTKASVIHMIHRNDVVRLLLDEKNKEKRKTIRVL